MIPADDQHLHRLRQRLLSRLRRKYELVSQPVSMGPIRLEFTRIADPDRVLDQVADEEDQREKRSGRRVEGDELHLPYWAELWDSAFGVGQFIVKNEQAGPGLSLLDLGCGMGLVGTISAALGARVLFADLEPPALLFAALNSLPWRERVRTRRVNWRMDDLGERFDAMLGADILYERAQWEHLDRFWRRHLKAGAPVLLGEPGRQTGDAFPEWIEERGWRLERFEEKTPARVIRIFRLRLPG